MYVADDELLAGQADAVVGNERKRERLLGIADVHHDLAFAAAAASCRSMRSHFERQHAVVDEARFSFGAGDRDHLAVSQHFGAVSVPTTAGTPSSRLTMAAWQVRPPRLVTMAAAFFMVGSQSGSVLSVTSTSPSLKFAEVLRALDHAHRPGGDLLADAAAA